MEKKNLYNNMSENLENFIDLLEKIVLQKNNNLKKWEDLFPAFLSLSKKYYDIIKNENMVEDVKKLLSYSKSFSDLPYERQIKRLNGLMASINVLKEKYLIDKIDEIPEKEVNFFTDVIYLKHVGQKRGKILRNLDLNNLYDCFYFKPREYEDRRLIKKIINCEHDEKVYVYAQIIEVDNVKINQALNIINMSVEDESGTMIITFFNQNYVLNFLKKGIKAAFFGKIENNYGRRQMKSPDFKVASNIEEIETGILPVYSLSAGISQNIMRNIFSKLLEQTYYLKEYIPNEIREKFKILEIKERVKGLHFPKSDYHVKRAVESLKYDELILFETAVISSKYNYKMKNKGTKKEFNGKLVEEFLKTLPFKLTRSQIDCYEEIKEDMKSENPMNRLLQGDVGSGKTIVSELALLDCFESGYQGAYMAPTSVLAKQQFKKIKEHFRNSDIKIEVILGETKESEKILIRQKLKDGEIDIIVGTHAIIQEKIEFNNLGLIIIDEQHRFGVNQRLELIQKAVVPDVLLMTATPIPRTYALTLYGDMDVSVIDEMPIGRKKVKTVFTYDEKIEKIYDFIEKELEKKNQAFFIYPLIEESEVMDLKNAKKMYEKIKERFKKYNTGLMHGKLNSNEKNEIMEKFVSGEINILVSTTVIEVGVDIPNATVMVIEHADRFGLSQLHQLRGRVGRSNKQSYCFLTVDKSISEESKTKINEFASTSDGFKVSEIDLKWRGPGKFFGVKQHGFADFVFFDITTDLEMVENVKKEIENIIKEDAELKNYPLLKKEMHLRYSEKLDFIKAL